MAEDKAMSDDAAKRNALQQQAQRLKQEFANLEEIRNVARPSYDPFTQQAHILFDSPLGECRVWWENDHWSLRAPDNKLVYAPPRKLRETLALEMKRLKEEAIRNVMELQINRLRDEYGDLEEFMSWARPLYDHELERAELRFDSPVGVCRVWWDETNRWIVRLPDGTINYAQRGDLREKLSTVRKFLRKGII
jgi:hypothetical protein